MSGTEAKYDARMNRSQVGGMDETARELVSEHTTDELGREINTKAGFKWRTGGIIGKEALNSVYAHLTGKFHTPRRDINRHTTKLVEDDEGNIFKKREKLVTSKDIRMAIAAEVGFEYPHDPERDCERFNKAERAMILAEMEKRGNQRDWLEDS